MINPAMITLMREARGWTQKDLAGAIQIAQGTLSKYELGLLQVPDSDIEAITSALVFDRTLLDEFVPLLGLGGDFLYRRRANVPAKDKRRVQAEANLIRIQTERLLRRAEYECDLHFPAIQPEEFNGRIESIAAEVRSAWRIPHGPIRNLTRVVESAGGLVFALDFGTPLIDGTNIRVPGTPPLLFLNRDVPGERHRFNLAHEIGHAVMHFSTSLGDPEEEANRFASELLMPKSQIRSDLRNLDLPAAQRLKGVWGVSMAAIIRRARQLGQISESTYRRMFTALSARGHRTVEPLPLEFEKPEVFERLKDFHRTQLGFSEDDLCRLLYTDRLGRIDVHRVPRLRLKTPGLFDRGPAAEA
ncbi:MAG: hypothetical protein AMXMBFR47_08380 [Planctomycetota bacterium]